MTDRLEGKPVAEALLADCRRRVAAGRERRGRGPMLVSVHRGEPTPFSVYLRRQEKTASAASVGFRAEALPANADRVALAQRLTALERDALVDAVLVEHPLPADLDFSGAVACLSPRKDVDGVSAPSLGRLADGHPVHAPAVAVGAIAIARHYRIGLTGRKVAVIGRSATVGTPLSLLLLVRGLGSDATVTVAHSRTPDLASAIAGAEVVFSCAGQPGLLNRTNVPQGAWVIDIGLSTVPDPTRPNGVRVVGDADPTALDGWAAGLTPVPGGVGPVTVARLMGNAVDAWEAVEPTR